MINLVKQIAFLGIRNMIYDRPSEMVPEQFFGLYVDVFFTRDCRDRVSLHSKQKMAAASSYIFFPHPECDWSTKKPSIIWFGSTSVDIGRACMNNWHR